MARLADSKPAATSHTYTHQSSTLPHSPPPFNETQMEVHDEVKQPAAATYHNSYTATAAASNSGYTPHTSNTSYAPYVPNQRPSTADGAPHTSPYQPATRPMSAAGTATNVRSPIKTASITTSTAPISTYNSTYIPNKPATNSSTKPSPPRPITDFFRTSTQKPPAPQPYTQAQLQPQMGSIGMNYNTHTTYNDNNHMYSPQGSNTYTHHNNNAYNNATNNNNMNNTNYDALLISGQPLSGRIRKADADPSDDHSKRQR